MRKLQAQLNSKTIFGMFGYGGDAPAIRAIKDDCAAIKSSIEQKNQNDKSVKAACALTQY